MEATSSNAKGHAENQSGATMLKHYLYQLPNTGYMCVNLRYPDNITLDRWKSILKNLVLLPALGLTAEGFLDRLRGSVNYRWDDGSLGDSSLFNAVLDYQYRVALIEINRLSREEDCELLSKSLLVRLICRDFGQVLAQMDICSATYILDALQVRNEIKY